MAEMLMEQHSLELVDYTCDSLCWKTKDGKSIPVNKMESSHINNTIRLLIKRKQDCNFWIAVFEDEIERRKP